MKTARTAENYGVLLIEREASWSAVVPYSFSLNTLPWSALSPLHRSSDLRRGRAFQENADDLRHIVLILRITAQFFPDRRIKKLLPMLFVLVAICAGNHVNKIRHLRPNHSLREKDRT